MDTNYTMRIPCKWCGAAIGTLRTVNGQDTVTCNSCLKHCYNAPKTETGRADRTVTTVHNGIKPSQRARILERATCRCEMCGNSRELHVGHILSVADGLEQGLNESELNSDENLCAMCAECNLGMGKLTASPRIYASILRARLHENAR